MQYPERHRIDFTMKDFKISETEVIELDKNCFPHIIEQQPTLEEDVQKTFLSGFFEKAAIAGNDKLYLKMLPLRVIINPNFMKKVVKFFSSTTNSDGISRIQAAAQGAIQGYSQQTRAGLVFAIEEHRTLDVDVEIDAPIFVFPLEFFLN
jgi:vacuolar protein sorting-associated protein 13A/C